METRDENPASRATPSTPANRATSVSPAHVSVTSERRDEAGTGLDHDAGGSASPTATRPPASAVILYDGECGLCDRAVQFILPRDPAGRFHFAALQSEWAQVRLRRHGLATSGFETMVLLEGERAYVRSTAALRIARGLRRWRWVYVFIAVPRPLRDALYGWVARHRLKWFPAPEACGLPKPGWRARFLA